jgi:hypothetical protein
MRLSELTDKYYISFFFQRELKEFQLNFRWFKMNRDGEIPSYWNQWFKDFILFRRKVLNDLEIEQAFVEWVGVGTYATDSLSSQSPMRRGMNVPQLMFFDYYEAAKKLTLELQKERQNEV